MKGRRLSRQRTAVLVGLANGKNDREMARAMSIAPATVHSHVAHLFHDLNVHSREHAVAIGLKLGFIELRQIVLEGECPGPSPFPNYCRCDCMGCVKDQCVEHIRSVTWLGAAPSHWCKRRLHSHCIAKDCTCGCGHNNEESE
jgi:LuxR family maltose regulon positive regulatory protein